LLPSYEGLKRGRKVENLGTESPSRSQFKQRTWSKVLFASHSNSKHADGYWRKRPAF